MTTLVWSEVRAFLVKRLEIAYREAATAEGLQAVGKAQGKVEMLTFLLNLPTTMKAEGEKA